MGRPCGRQQEEQTLEEAIRRDLLEYLAEQSAPVSLAELRCALAISQEQAEALVRRLTEEGEVLQTKRGKVALPRLLGCVRGRIQGTRKGFAFLLPEDGGEDVFLPQGALSGAMHGDRALVRTFAPSKRGKGMQREGEVLKILQRARETIVGTLEKGHYASFVIPEDRRLPDLFIPKGRTGGAQHGQLVVAKITAYQQANRNAEGEVTEILGQAGSADADLLAIIRHYGLKEKFDTKTLEAAAKVPQAVSAEEAAGREDFRPLLTVTIDGADARDFDDAISLEETEAGYTLYVHIADVTHYVRPKSALDKEAYERGTSVYFPGAVLPMLPEQLSNGICSLNQKVDRLTLSCVMQVDKNGYVQSYRFARGVICVDRRVTYEDANAILQRGDKALAQDYAPVLSLLQRMQALCEKLTLNKQRRGSLDFDFPESEFVLDEQGRAVDVFMHERGVANRMIEECMLLANECAAKFAGQNDLPFLYRVHEEPAEEKMAEFYLMCKALGVPFTKPKRKTKPRDLQQLLSASQDEPYADAVSRVMLRSLKKARYCEEDLGHFGLALKHYCHFTSPIRRYPDVLVHRAIIAKLQGGLSEKALEQRHREMPELGRHTSECERVAMEAERAVDDLKRAEYMEDKIGECYEGVISQVTAFGIFVELENTVEGLVPVASLEDDYYIYDEQLFRLIGKATGTVYALGQRVCVQVTAVDLAMRRVEFQLERAEKIASVKPERPGGRGQRGKGRKKRGHRAKRRRR